MIINYIAKEKDKDKKLKDILYKRMYVSKELIKKAKYLNCILVNGKSEFVSYSVKENDNIQVDLDKYLKEVQKEAFEDKFILVDKPLDILYEDEYLLIVNKPYNMPTHPSSDNYDNTLSNIVAAYFKKQGIKNIHIVTRLDKNTTGICIFAKNEYIQELFVRKKEQINLKKEYTAIVKGLVKDDYGIIEKNIKRMDNTILLRETTQDNNVGDYAKTEYSVISRNIEKDYTILNVILHTGRTHQIRVHMIDLGHILLGDTLYAEYYNIPNIDKLIKRQALHARKVSFNHPITDKYIEIETALPEDMKKLLYF